MKSNFQRHHGRFLWPIFILIFSAVLLCACASEEKQTPVSSNTSVVETDTADQQVNTQEEQPQTVDKTPDGAGTQTASKDTASADTKPAPAKTPASASSDPAPNSDTSTMPDTEIVDEEDNDNNEQTCTIAIYSHESTILETTTMAFNSGDTVFDITKAASEANSITLDSSGSGASVYVKGIDGLYEFDEGSGSGWMYKVNGKFPSKSSGSYEISTGDVIVWQYTLDMKATLKESLESS